MILPGATLGVLGGGQLGRMFTVAARTMGYHVMVLDPDQDSPAGRIADEHLHASYGDLWALRQLAEACQAITVEFENIPAATLRELERHCPLRPSALALETTQDRMREKTFVERAGIPTTPYRAVRHMGDLEQAVTGLSPPYILKRSSLGYDGKGQVPVADLGQARAAFRALGEVPCVLEERVSLRQEISVILARSAKGDCVSYPLAENVHRGGILEMTLVPARVETGIARAAVDAGLRLAAALDYCGVMAIEFFITEAGDLLVNEIAPRPHNSGHYTLDACVTSQFEQQVRMVCGLPAGSTRLLSPVVMVNLLGDVWEGGSPDWGELFAHPEVKLHLYGKREPRPGRKMGHLCSLNAELGPARATAAEILGRLRARGGGHGHG
jgi:5-(carboxyamino)imidazole ribonucleotide synthase